ncbi:IS66 family transposase [Mucilaginibacter sp. dw_454]|uniref:IS66 family transposase n=1 Tax=Mucilaginibacter sp. dw_454 TaxID=2720079 RepID=UPI001BD2F231|nr:IS66 family transposase [Mucilaginibacter sp. dw_454]
MELQFNALEAMLYCSYKAWKISKEEIQQHTDPSKINNPIAIAAWEMSYSPDQSKLIKSSRNHIQAQQLLNNTIAVLSKDQPPPYYKISHCAECRFKDDCHRKLVERDCISLLPSMSLKSLLKYHNKGITTITQLSYLFKPRRRRAPNPQSSYLWELKALAIREQKTFVIEPPVLNNTTTAIYLDFEGTANEQHIYLLGGLVIQDGKPEEKFSFWSYTKESEQANFNRLFKLFNEYPDAEIYHYGSYETKVLRLAVKKSPFLKYWPAIEKRMVNLLAFLRTHVYPPTYGNGLKELGDYLDFKWSDTQADGFLSMVWRKKWEETGLDEWKDKLLQYNHDDCRALRVVHQWFDKLASDTNRDDVQQVAQMKKHTPYRLQHNKEFGDDFQLITKASYFDYQRNKIYWRNELKKQTPSGSSARERPEQLGQGHMAWRPKKINEVVIMPPLKACPGCGHHKLYQSHETKSSVLQTDLKFTASGIRTHVTEYRSGTAKCAKCGKKTMNKTLRIMHYGDNLFALVLDYYVNFHISNEAISKLIQEHYHIWVSPMYLVMYKNRWWNKTWAPVATYIRSIVLNSPVIHIDETTIKLSRESGYVWVFATTHTVFYYYASTREVGFLQQLLKGYEGIIVSDFYPGYETLNVKSQKCLIHLIRDLNDDLFKNQFDQEYNKLVPAFNQLMRRIVETIDKHGLKQTHLNKHIKDTEYFYGAFVERNYKSETAGKYARRFKKHWEQLWTFLHHDNVPWNNNNAEAAVKAFAQHRRGVKGQMHVRGITEYLEMLTVAQTCRYRNISFLSFLQKKKGIWENVPPEVMTGFLPFEQAKLYVHRQGFERQIQWTAWKQSGKRPPFIPSNPQVTYSNNGWVDWHDWLGFDFLPFIQARTFIRRQQLKSGKDYREWLASDQRPKFIPTLPEKEYQHTGWIGLKDYLGIGSL